MTDDLAERCAVHERNLNNGLGFTCQMGQDFHELIVRTQSLEAENGRLREALAMGQRQPKRKPLGMTPKGLAVLAWFLGVGGMALAIFAVFTP